MDNRLVARMWRRKGYECLVHKRGEQWFLTLTEAGRVVTESNVESPGEAIRKSEELRDKFML